MSAHTSPSLDRLARANPSEPVFRCSTGTAGQRYTLLEHVAQNGPARLDRRTLAAAVQHALRTGTISAATAHRIDADLAAVSDNFLARLGAMFQYGTLSTGDSSGRVPPAGIPEIVVCEPAAATLACRDLNGDDHAAVGSGIYAATPAADWVPAPPHRPDPAWGFEVAILGHAPTGAELRLLEDLLVAGTTSSSASPRQPQRAPAAHASP